MPLPFLSFIHPVSSKDGTALIKDQLGILTCWAEHLSKLLNCNNSINPSLVYSLPQLPVILNFDKGPTTFQEVCEADRDLKNMAAGPNCILKSYSIAVITCCTDFISFSLEFGHPVTSLNSGRMPKS